MKKILVSGIGRSGTTLIYQQLAKLLLVENLKTNFRYEPYLRDIKQPIVRNSPFGMEQLNHFGISTHLRTPLFLQDATAEHSRFLETLFAAPYDGDLTVTPDAYLTKIIRGSGRLRAYLSHDPDLKIIGCLRNPFDTINSSLGMFSLFGEEFHKSDRARFRQERSARGHVEKLPPDTCNSIEWLAAWWLDFTQETLAVAAEYPDNVFLFCYEEFLANRAQTLNALLDFIGIRNEGIFLGLNELAGPTIKSNSLTNIDIIKLYDGFEFYKSAVLEPALGRAETEALQTRLMTRYVGGAFTLPVAGTRFGRMSSIQLRDILLRQNNKTPTKNPSVGKLAPKHCLHLDELIRQHSNGAPSISVKTPCLDIQSLKKGKTFGVVLTNHNNSQTIRDAVLSCLNQTLPFDEIVVVDDKSTDTSLKEVNILAEHYSSIKVLPLSNCLGPSAARDLGLRHLSTDFCTQLDGDDIFWPGKNEGEVRAIDGDEDVIAFSDILLVTQDKSLIQNTKTYASKGGADIFYRLLTRREYIPRDMTFARRHYFEAGGYDFLGKLYEDWDFKLRLAMLPNLKWRRSEAVAGTIYNRLQPGLSGKEPDLHVRALVLIFFKSIAYSQIKPEHLPDAFDSALRAFKDLALTKSARAWLVNLTRQQNFDRRKLAGFASSREIHALGKQDFKQTMTQLANETTSALPPAEPFCGQQLNWQALTGLKAWSPPPESSLFHLVAKGGNLLAKEPRGAVIEIDTPKSSDGFVVTMFLPATAHKLSFSVAGRTHEISIESICVGERQTLSVPIKMPKGKSLISFQTTTSDHEYAGTPPRVFLETLQPWPEKDARA